MFFAFVIRFNEDVRQFCGVNLKVNEIFLKELFIPLQLEFEDTINSFDSLQTYFFMRYEILDILRPL